MRDEATHLVVRDAVGDQRLDTSRLLLHAEQRDLGLEVVDRAELAIDAGESQVGDLVKLAQRPKNGNADLVGRYFRLAQGADRILDQLPETGELVLRDGPSLTGLTNPVDHLVAVEHEVRVGRCGWWHDGFDTHWGLFDRDRNPRPALDVLTRSG